MHSLIMITVTSYNSEKKTHPSIEYIIKNILINVFEYLQRRSIQCKFICWMVIQLILNFAHI